MLRTGRAASFVNNCFSISKKLVKALSTNPATMVSDNKEQEVVPDKSSTAIESEKRKTEDNLDEICLKKPKIMDEASNLTSEPFVRIKKRNYAMMLGYLGKNYCGMQRNTGIPTIEEDLIEAMFKAGLINNKGLDALQLISFQRSSRTDKGVSAAKQVCSLKLPEDSEQSLKDRINEHLCEDIRVFGLKRVTRGFNSKSSCFGRTYSYTLPTYAFAPEDMEAFKETEHYQCDEDELKRLELLSTIDGKKFNEYKLPEETFERINKLLEKFKGTKNFHNYTTRLKPLDPSAKRYMKEVFAEKPFMFENMEFITLKIHGQSFMMHQIRKMVSMVVAVIRNIVDDEMFEKTFSSDKIYIPRAPSLGLVLNHVHYDQYDKRYGGDGLHEKLDWAEYNDEVEEFMHRKILKDIYKTELDENSMLVWLAHLKTNSFSLKEENSLDLTDL